MFNVPINSYVVLFGTLSGLARSNTTFLLKLLNLVYNCISNLMVLMVVPMCVARIFFYYRNVRNDNTIIILYQIYYNV